MSGKIRLEHGSGGALSRELVENIIYPRFRGDAYQSLSDATEITSLERPCITTDSFVVDPLFFPGSDIGRLAVFGSCNDLAVSGARPLALTVGCIIEEGLEIEVLERVLDSLAGACEEASVNVITGDTKVVPLGAGSGIYINTCCVGNVEFSGRLTDGGIRAGDSVILSGPIGAHGIAVLAAREGLPVDGIESDCANLFPACSCLYEFGDNLRVMRDATRGGVSAVTNELISGSELSILLNETNIPIDPAVASAANLLGLNPLEIANEGAFIAVVASEQASRAVEALRSGGNSPSAVIIGTVMTDYPGRVVLETEIGGRRIVDIPRGLLLPRIC